MSQATADITPPTTSSTTEKEVILHPQADLLLTVGNLRAKVCKSQLQLASPVFRVLLDAAGNWQENSTGILDLSDDDPAAVKFVVYGLHYRLHELSIRHLEPRDLFHLALFAEKYDCLDLVGGFLGEGRWLIRTHGLKTLVGFEEWLITCHAFGWKNQFLACAEVWVNKVGIRALRFRNMLIPPCMRKVLEDLFYVRSQTQEGLSDILSRTEICACKCRGYTSPILRISEEQALQCSALISGSITKLQLERPQFFRCSSEDEDFDDWLELYRSGIARPVQDWSQSMTSARCLNLVDPMKLTKNDDKIADLHQLCGFRQMTRAFADAELSKVSDLLREVFSSMPDNREPEMHPYLLGLRNYRGDKWHVSTTSDDEGWTTDDDSCQDSFRKR